eukprot:COSAG03_NODE_380_length_8364_cov_20.212099_5_plen_140_part_00
MSLRCVEDVIAAESDAVLLASSKITELQIQRNEIFIRTTAEEPEYQEERASGKSSLNIQDTTDLLAKAGQVRKVNKDRQALRSTRRGPKRDGDGKRSMRTAAVAVRGLHHDCSQRTGGLLGCAAGSTVEGIVGSYNSPA